MEAELKFRMADVEPYYPEVDGIRSVLEWQRKFHYGITPSRKGSDYKLISGGLGCGMKTAICADIAFHLDRFPGIELTVVANYDYVIDEFLSDLLHRSLPWGSDKIKAITAKSRKIEMANGSFLLMRSCADPNLLRGFACHKAYMIDAATWTKTEQYEVEVDEIEGYEQPDKEGFEQPIYTGKTIIVKKTRDVDIGKEIFTALAERCRARGDFPRGVTVQQSPRGHNWAYNVFVKPAGDDNFIEADGCRQWEYTNLLGQTFYTLGIPSSANTFLTERFVQGERI